MSTYNMLCHLLPCLPYVIVMWQDDSCQVSVGLQSAQERLTLTRTFPCWCFLTEKAESNGPLLYLVPA